jgi:hypothetical protein
MKNRRLNLRHKDRRRQAISRTAEGIDVILSSCGCPHLALICICRLKQVHNAHYAIGLDSAQFCRSLIVDVKAAGSWPAMFLHIRRVKTVDHRCLDPNLARQNPADYVSGIEATVKGAIRKSKESILLSIPQIIGIGVDTTGSSPMPVDENGQPLVPRNVSKTIPRHGLALEGSYVTERPNR